MRQRPELDTNNKNVIDAFEDIGSLDDYFKKVKQKNQEILTWKKDQEKKLVEKQKEELKKMTTDLIATENSLRKQGIKDFEAYRKKLVADFQKEQAKKEKEELKKIFDIRTGFEKKFGTDKNLIESRRENKEIIKVLDALLEATGSLTEEQQKTREQAEKDLKEGNKELAKKIGIDTLGKILGNLTNAINSNIETYTKYQSGINARLQGMRLGGSLSDMGRSLRYGPDKFSALESKLTWTLGVSPYFKQEDVLTNLQSLVQAGIASNVEQRAFLQTVKDDVATTFDAANGALLRIIRLQQSDSTAARLGMEAYLTRFLNELVSNTEYLNHTFDTVQEALLEASSQMSTKASTEFEYIVQKWLGALTGVGLSETTAGNIAQALGYLGSGNIEGLSNSPLQNLLVMSSTRAGLDYSNLLTSGLTATSANKLMESMVNYMIGINESGSNVIKSQYAQTFGLTISDLKAASQLANSIKSISGSVLGYSNMYNELGYQLGQLPERMGMSELISNVFSNAQFSLATGVAKNPALAALWKVTDMIESATGGINIPTISALGNFVDLNATVEQLMKLGIVGTGSLGMIGQVISGLGSTFNPASMLTKLGIIEGNEGILRGLGIGSRTSGLTTSMSSYIGNTSSEGIYSQTLTSAEEGTSKQQEIQKQEAIEENPILDYLNTKLDDHLLTLIQKVEEIDEKLSGTIAVDISSEDIQGLSTGFSESMHSLLI